MAGLRFIGLIGRGGALSLLSLGFNTIGKAAIGARTAATGNDCAPDCTWRHERSVAGVLGRVAVGLRGMALAVPGVAAIGSALTAVGAALAAISAPVMGNDRGHRCSTRLPPASPSGNTGIVSLRCSQVSRNVSAKNCSPTLQLAQPLFDALASVGEAIFGCVARGRPMDRRASRRSPAGSARRHFPRSRKARWEKSGYDIADRIITGIKSVTTKLGNWPRRFHRRLQISSSRCGMVWCRSLPI